MKSLDSKILNEKVEVLFYKITNRIKPHLSQKIFKNLEIV